MARQLVTTVLDVILTRILRYAGVASKRQVLTAHQIHTRLNEHKHSDTANWDTLMGRNVIATVRTISRMSQRRQ